MHSLVRARMRPFADQPIDPHWVRRNMGRPRSARRLMARFTGARLSTLARTARWPGGELLSWPGAQDNSPVLLYLHGGGFIACSPETHRPLVASLVRRVAGRAYVPAYRLAPEFPYPAALQDATNAYRYMTDDCRIDPARIVIAGDSAGGGLALALAMSLRDQGAVQPSAVVMFSPWTDLAATGKSLDENSERCAMFAGDTIRRAARFYLGDTDPVDPRVSPLYGDFRGLPPLLLHASEDEVLRDDTLRVATRARAAGVQVSVRLWPHVPHVWQFFVAVLPEARESVNAAVIFMNECVAARAPHLTREEAIGSTNSTVDNAKM